MKMLLFSTKIYFKHRGTKTDNLQCLTKLSSSRNSHHLLFELKVLVHHNYELYRI